MLDILAKHDPFHCHLAETEGLFGDKASGGCSDDDVAEADSMLAGDEHFPEVKYGTEFS
jgi:hypothetical protein